MADTCRAPGCDTSVRALDLCTTHYFRWRRTGTTRLLTLEQRFWNLVERTDSCWLWRGARHRRHGQYRGRLAHYVAWEFANGPMPEGYRLTQRCGEPLCVRLAHLTATRWHQ